MPPYPFTAVVGLDDLRLALLINAVSPGVGGVLVRGEKGTAKSTIVRALAALLPAVDVVAGLPLLLRPGAARPDCPDGPHGAARRRRARRRLVELPVGATEDRVVGSLDLERALTDGRQGLRARPARRRAPRRPLRRRGQPAARPPGRPAARRRRAGHAPTSSARACRSSTRPGSCWSAR